jgi:hypothetical protein
MPQFTKDRRTTRERRESPREERSGIVEITCAAPEPVAIQGVLVEASATGFRVSHNSTVLEPGLTVSFRREGARGRARVIWTHILDGRRVSGFQIIGARS